MNAGERVLSNERNIENNNNLDISNEIRMPVSPQPNSKGSKYTPMNISDKKDRSEKDILPFHIVSKEKVNKNMPVFNKPTINFRSTPYLNKFPLSSSN